MSARRADLSGADLAGAARRRAGAPRRRPAIWAWLLLAASGSFLAGMIALVLL